METVIRTSIESNIIIGAIAEAEQQLEKIKKQNEWAIDFINGPYLQRFLEKIGARKSQASINRLLPDDFYRGPGKIRIWFNVWLDKEIKNHGASRKKAEKDIRNAFNDLFKNHITVDLYEIITSVGFEHDRVLIKITI